jgi:hypothetical protein
LAAGVIFLLIYIKMVVVQHDDLPISRTGYDFFDSENRGLDIMVWDNIEGLLVGNVENRQDQDALESGERYMNSDRRSSVLRGVALDL